MPMSGIVISLKKNELKSTQVLKITHVTYKKHRYYLTPGIQKAQRRVTVRGTDIGDIPTKYTMTGLESYEIPVVGERYQSSGSNAETKNFFWFQVPMSIHELSQDLAIKCVQTTVQSISSMEGS